MVDDIIDPCPFCGGDARFETYAGSSCAVVCQTCGCGTPVFRLEDGMKAVAKWNRRADRKTKLLPCPFCGSMNLVGSTDVGINMDHEDPDAPDGTVATIYCDDCGCQIQAKVTHEDSPLHGSLFNNANKLVMKKWNSRVAVAYEG